MAAALAVAGLALAPVASATEDVARDRIAGTNRFGTAGAVCDAVADEGASVDTVVVATGRNFPDALAAAPLAAANDGCVLLVEPGSLPAETADAVNELDPTEAIVVGGSAAVSDAVVDALEDEGVAVRRVAGANRYCTASEIAEEIGSAAGATAILATGLNAADALAAGAVAAAGDGTGVMPILLAAGNDLPTCTEDALGDFDEVIVVGGTGAVGSGAAAEAGDATGDDSVTRLAGPNRFSTSTAIAEYAVDELDFALTEVLIAAGLPPAAVGPFSPDALVAGPLGGLREAPILLSESPSDLGAAATAFLRAHDDTIEQVTGIGGTGVVGDAVLAQADAAATSGDDPEEPGGGGTPGPITGTPELSSVSHVRTTVDGHVDVRYTFDENLDQDVGILDIGAFHLHSYEGVNVVADQAEIDGTIPTSVVARFLNASGFFAGVTTAAVDDGTVETATTLNNGPANPEGEGSLKAVAFPAGATAAVSLVDILPPVVATDGLGNGIHVRAGFTFNQPTYDDGACADPGGAYLITTDLSDGDDMLRSVGCVNAGAVDGKTTYTFIFAPNQATTAAAQAIVTKVRAGQIDGSTIEDQQGNDGVTAVRSVAGTASFTTANPDLTLAALRPGTLVADPDTIDFTFDEDIDLLDGTAFAVVYRDGSVVYSASAVEQAARIVRATFSSTALNTAEFVAAAYVDPGAVDGDVGGGENYPSQYGFAAKTYNGGTSMAPNLTSVSKTILAATATTNPFMSLGQRAGVVTYTFDRDIDPASFTYSTFGTTDVIDQSNRFGVYNSNGERFDFGPVADEKYCLHHDEHTKGAKLIICYAADGGGILPTGLFRTIELGGATGIASDTLTSALPPADPWNFASYSTL